MARHSIAEPRVAAVVERLVDLVLYHGSVRATHAALVEALATGGDTDVIYPNRLHTLLSADVSRGVNSATLDALERALDRVVQPLANGEGDRVRTEILRAHASIDSSENDGALNRRVADQSGHPMAVVDAVLGEAGLCAPPTVHMAPPLRPPRTVRVRREASVDWSFQETAVKSCLDALRKSPNRKVGLIVPTGGGKTRIATRIGLRWLLESMRESDIIVWVTHRRRLHEQARRELQRALGTSELTPATEATALLEQRFRFTMISELAATLTELGDRVSLVVVDEAHHAAAPSYGPIFGDRPIRGLFLTATPNRADSLPIGIDEIAFSITYRELFARGVIVEPIFDEPITIDDLNWSHGNSLADLADYLLERTETDIRKLMVAVSRTDQAEMLYDAVHDALERRRTHVLGSDDLIFVHGTATSTGASATDLLDEFGAHPRGILIATSQLIGEGFDDPTIDGVVVTYPSTSIGHLMQVAGRAIRSAPGKSQAHVIQVHASRLAYHFEQRWLYQDISDALRPYVIDLVYRDANDLKDLVSGLLSEHNVDGAVRARTAASLMSVATGERYSLLLTGLPYFDDVANFLSDAPWGAVLVGPSDRARFLDVFNVFADRLDEVKDHTAFLAKYLRLDPLRGSEWKSFMDMLAAMDYARHEIDRSPYEGERSRDYVARRGTSWLKYVNFEYRPVVPAELDEFLGDAVNRDEIVHEFLVTPARFACAVKIPLPLAGTLAFLFDGASTAWFNHQRVALVQRVAIVTPRRSLSEIDEWRYALTNVAIPQVVLMHIDRLLSDSAYAQYVLLLGADPPRTDAVPLTGPPVTGDNETGSD